jgi:hypothetical protein
VNKPAYPRAGGVELGWERRRIDQETAPALVQLTGRTGGDQVVAFDGDASLRGQLIDVEIVDARNLTLFGKRIPAAELRNAPRPVILSAAKDL